MSDAILCALGPLIVGINVGFEDGWRMGVAACLALQVIVAALRRSEESK